MATCARESRSQARKSPRNRVGCTATVREVCLVGERPETTRWRTGSRVEWGGRPYQVASLQVPGATRQHAGRRYAHLVPVNG